MIYTSLPAGCALTHAKIKEVKLKVEEIYIKAL